MAHHLIRYVAKRKQRITKFLCRPFVSVGQTALSHADISTKHLVVSQQKACTDTTKCLKREYKSLVVRVRRALYGHYNKMLLQAVFVADDALFIRCCVLANELNKV